MAKRSLDVFVAFIGLVLGAPLLALAWIGIRLSDNGPVVYRTTRVGRDGRPFVMFKLRTMRIGREKDSAITAQHDPRVFRFGSLLRAAKIDELPQLINVLRGDMSIVGPRPEDPGIVERYYTATDREILSVRPGLTSPGTLWASTNGESFIDDADPETSYAGRLLPQKLALDLVYVGQQRLAYDVELVGRTLWMIAAKLAGRHRFANPPELPLATLILLHAGSGGPHVAAASPGRLVAAPRAGRLVGAGR
jgi:lipopolysaccharide/colanic/teichoic acid biosynthesis glycosyltransferase